MDPSDPNFLADLLKQAGADIGGQKQATMPGGPQQANPIQKAMEELGKLEIPDIASTLEQARKQLHKKRIPRSSHPWLHSAPMPRWSLPR